MEDRIITALQDIVDNIEEGRAEGDTYQEKFYQEYLNFAMRFTESITGKQVKVSNWKVRLEDEND